jgi:gliding motility-associated-like protein
MDSVSVSLDLSGPDVLLTADSITCDHPEAIVQVRSPDSLYAIEWEGPGGIVSSMATIRVRQEGWHRVLVEDSVSCITIDSIYVLADTLSPVVEIEQQGSLGCGSGTVQLEVSISSGATNLSWHWLDPSGVLFGSNEDVVTVDSQGIYSVVAVNNSNGCETTVEVSVEAGNANALEAIWIPVPPVCPGESSGKFILEAISGHTGFFSVTLNGVDLGMTDSIGGLSSGRYAIQIQDSLGCEWAGQLLLPPADTFWVDLGPDRSIELGEMVTLSPVFNPGASGVFTLSWSPPNTNCPTCLQRIVSPASDTRYEILVSDVRGCEARDDVWIRVRASSRLFLPNSFTPNGDGVNDGWTISIGEDVDQLLELQIFDRWGGLVHSLQNLTLVDGMELWDGTMGGRELNPAVFVYRLVYTTSGGNRYVTYGDITMLK